MKIHTISCWGEFTEQEIQDVIDFVKGRLHPIKKTIESSGGIILVFIKSDESVYRPIGFSDRVSYQIFSMLK